MNKVNDLVNKIKESELEKEKKKEESSKKEEQLSFSIQIFFKEFFLSY